MNRKVVGIVLLCIMIILGVSYKTLVLDKKKSNTTTVSTDTGKKIEAIKVKGLTGSGKTGLLEDEDVKRILKDKYGLIVDYTKMGSLDIVASDTTGVDFVFPSSQVALESYKQTQGKKIVKMETVFNTPLVFFSWDIVTDALVKQKIVEKVDGVYYVNDFSKLVEYLSNNKQWSDIGVKELYGKMSVISTDPTKSSSGIMFAGLLGSVMNKDVINEGTVDKYIPSLKNIFGSLGYLETSSGDLFNQYISTGVGAKPVIVGYENQAVEFSLQNPKVWEQQKSKMTIIYPRPTEWSPHTVIALNDKGVKFLEAMKDPDIKKIAWEKHGFRTGMLGVENDPKVLSNITGIPKEITQTIPTPDAKTMEKIINSLKQ